MKTILLLGKDGQIGWELQRTLSPLGTVVAPTSATCDLANPDSIIETVNGVNPQLIVNAAAYTSVDQAESAPGLARAVNATAPGILAEEAKRRSIPLVHYSTDYVFDGTNTAPYGENDRPNPLNVYGQTKWEGEQAVAAAGGSYLILRTSWIYSGRSRNFLLTMLKLAAEKDELRIVGDQKGTPNWSRLVAETTALMLPQFDASLSGTYHVSSSGETSWYGFAGRIFATRTNNKPQLKRITTEEYPTPAKRPPHSTLHCGKLATVFGLQLPPWEEALALFIETLPQ